MDRRLQQRCNSRFQHLERAARRRLLVHGLVSWLALAGLVVLALLAVLGWLDAPRWTRLGLMISGGALIAAAAYASMRQP